MIRGVIFPSFLPYSFELNHTFKGYGLYRSITHWYHSGVCSLQERRIHRDTDNSFGMNIRWKYFLKECSDEQLMIANVDSPFSGTRSY